MSPVGLIIMLGEYKQYLWTTTLYLSLQALITMLMLISGYGFKTAFECFALCSLFSLVLEYIGTSTGFPFGNYRYSSTLQPLISDVPLAIIMSWFVLVVNSLLSLEKLHSSRFYVPVLLSSIMILSIDLMLEPFASFINEFWIWESHRIPIQNFISWFAASFILSAIVFYLIRNSSKHHRMKSIRNISLIILLTNIMNFIIVNLTYSYYELTLVGIILFLSAYLPLIIPCKKI